MNKFILSILMTIATLGCVNAGPYQNKAELFQEKVHEEQHSSRNSHHNNYNRNK